MELSELEGCVLGVICRAQPCTAYLVRKEFRASLTTTWRASTGAIYPLISKLVRTGLVAEREVEGDRRGSRSLSATLQGRAALKQWVTDRPEWLADPSADAIPTRYQFLELVKESRPAMIAAWRVDTELALQRTNARLAQHRADGNALEVAAHRSTQLQLQARLTWLDELATA